MSTRILGLLICAAAVAVLCFLSLAVGTRVTPLQAVWDAIVAYDPNNTDQLVIRELRVPRTILGVLVGAALGLAGAVMQGVTRNPLADPGILGVNAGASLFVVFGIWIGVSSPTGYVWFAFVGAAVASVVGKNEERAVASLFSPGGTHAMKGEFSGAGDFEVLAFLVVLPGQSTQGGTQ